MDLLTPADQIIGAVTILGVLLLIKSGKHTSPVTNAKPGWLVKAQAWLHSR